MTKAELLIEAIQYAEETGTDWWEVFNSTKEAEKIIRAAQAEEIEEPQAVCLLAAMDIDVFDCMTIEEAYNNALRELYKQLEDTK